MKLRTKLCLVIAAMAVAIIGTAFLPDRIILLILAGSFIGNEGREIWQTIKINHRTKELYESFIKEMKKDHDTPDDPTNPFSLV